MEEKLEKAMKILDNELFMRKLVFKNKPNVLKKKKEEIEFVKEVIEELKGRACGTRKKN
jgi:hypothetical protein